MPEVTYGDRKIVYTVEEKAGLNGHYIIVEKNMGVVLKGSLLAEEKANAYILKKARWILDKLDLVAMVQEGDLVTGSRIPYLGKQYYTEVYFTDHAGEVEIAFNHSRFRITVSGRETRQEIREALEEFYREKAAEKIGPRVAYWSVKTAIEYNRLCFRKQAKRWGSCTPLNNIVINTEAIRLPWSLIDYLIVHELCHVKHKDHSKAFRAEVSKYLKNWKGLDERMKGMKM